MAWSLIIQALTFRATVIFVDYAILVMVLQRPVEAGFLTIIRHISHTFMYWLHEVTWANRRLNHIPTDQVASRQLTLYKTLSFRGISLIADLLLLWLLTGNIKASTAGTVLIGVTNTIFFYLHDRWWQAWRTRSANR